MVNIILVQLLTLLFSTVIWAKMDISSSQTLVGERRLDDYHERYDAFVWLDPYQGKASFKDDLFLQHYFSPYGFSQGDEILEYLRSELGAGFQCPNTTLSQHFNDIHYAYRLITLSYLLEGQWHMDLLRKQLGLKEGCRFDVKAWARSCQPKSPDMRKFVERLIQFQPNYTEKFPVDYNRKNWWKEYSSGQYNWYSQYRLKAQCQDGCQEKNLNDNLKNICAQDEELMTKICSEIDEVWGLSENRDAYFLISQSNIINTFNKQGEALGCLRRFSQVMSSKEVKYPVLDQLFPWMQLHLRQEYGERFIQGRSFFYGAGKEFEEKGLRDLYVRDQTLKIETIPKEAPEVVKVTPLPEVKVSKVEPKKVEPPPAIEPPKEIVEIRAPVKSAFLQAAEVRQGQNLSLVEVDMTKLKYDYVFTLNMINTLSQKLKTFMSREALTEMMAYDKLGTKAGPVPLLFIKYMIDMEEHQGLWNLLAILGDEFYVSNEIDASFTPAPEKIKLQNDDSTSRQWQIYVIRP